LGSDRLAAFLADLTDAGFDWSLIEGDADTAIPEAASRITAGVKDLPLDKRVITLDVFLGQKCWTNSQKT
jgi:hypothetical protein